MTRVGAETQGSCERVSSWLSAVLRGLRLLIGGNPDGFEAVSAEPSLTVDDFSRLIEDRLLARRLAVVARHNRRVVHASRLRIETYRQDRQRAVRSAVLKRQVASPIRVPLSSCRMLPARESALSRSRVIAVDFQRGVSRPLSRTAVRLGRAA